MNKSKSPFSISSIQQVRNCCRP